MLKYNHYFLCMACLFIIGVSLSGCVATRQEVDGLGAEIARLQRQIANLQVIVGDSHEVSQKNQLDIALKLKDIRNELSLFAERNDRLSVLISRLDDLEVVLAKQFASLPDDKLSGSVSIQDDIKPSTKEEILTPTELYKTAYNDYTKGNYNLAINGFKKYLNQHSKTELSSSAQYWLGECYYSKTEYETAIKEFEKVETEYTKSEKVPTAKLKMAYSLSELNREKEAIKVLNDIIELFPLSDEAELAQGKKERLLNNIQ